MILIEHDHPPRTLPRRELARFLLEASARLRLPGEVTALLTTDARMQELNRSFRRKNKPTDVLSFPAAEAPDPAMQTGGDLAVSLDIARAQAAELGHSLTEEVKILILHGLLHLAGHDHEQDEGQMARKEARLRREFELPLGLIQRTVQVAPRVKAVTAVGVKTAAKTGIKAGKKAAAKRTPSAAAQAAANPGSRAKSKAR